MIKMLLVLIMSIFILSGCGTLQKEIHVKMNRPIHIQKPVETVAVIIAPSASKVDADIARGLVEKLTNKGVEVISNPKVADYTVALSVPTKIKLKDENGNAIALTALSTGVAGTVITYGAGYGHNAIGAGLGSAVGGAVLAYVLQDSSLAMQLDVVISQNKEKPIVQQKTRLFSTVKQMHLDKEDGQKVLIDNLSTELAKLF